MSLKDRLDEETQTAEAWRPEPGDELIGTVRRYNIRKMDDGSEYPVVTIETDDGDKHAWHAFHAVGRGQLEEDKPRPGDEIGVRYLGKVEGDPYDYHNYRVAVEHKTPEPVPEGNETPPVSDSSDFQPAPVRSDDDEIPF